MNLVDHLSLDPVGQDVDDLETPVPVIDIDVVERNLTRWQKRCDGLGIANRPHIKTHKLTGLAKYQLALGAHGITVHPRPDERHIRRTDVTELAALLATEYGGAIEYNIEGNPVAELIELIRRVRPTQATLVPDSPDAATSDQGWDIAGNARRLRPIIAELHDLGIRVSLFVEADVEVVHQAKEVGADRIELYTGPYADAFGTREGEAVFERYVCAGRAALDLGVGLNAGHDLDLNNLPKLQQAMPWLAEISIGHAFTADALAYGFETAVGLYIKALHHGSIAA